MRSRDFELPANVNVRNFVHGAFGPHIGSGNVHEVVIEFSREKALLVSSRSWHPSQRIESLPSGRVRLTFTCADLAPVVSWVLEWGPHARAIAPGDLVQSVTKELREASNQYA